MKVNEIDELILRKLSCASGPVPGTALSRELGISRVALWKRIQGLEERGCRISATRKGYVLEGEDLWQDPFSAAGLPLVYLRETDSTMDEAWHLAARGGLHGTMVTAETQKSGRGQQGRTWVSPPGGLYLTLILHSPLPQTWTGSLVMEAACTLLEMLDGLGMEDLEFHWPNDLYLRDRKVGGLLAESAGSPDNPRFYTLGLGLNMRSLTLEDRPAAALEDLGAPLPRRRTLARNFQEKLSQWALRPACTPDRWTSRLLRKSAPLTALTWQEEVRSLTPSGLGADGSLLGRHREGSWSFGATRRVWPTSSESKTRSQL